MGSDLPKILEAIEEAGYVLRVTKSGHIGVYTFEGEWITTLAGVAGRPAFRVTALAPLKRRGFRWPP